MELIDPHGDDRKVRGDLDVEKPTRVINRVEAGGAGGELSLALLGRLGESARALGDCLLKLLKPLFRFSKIRMERGNRGRTTKRFQTLEVDLEALHRSVELGADLLVTLESENFHLEEAVLGLGGHQCR